MQVQPGTQHPHALQELAASLGVAVTSSGETAVFLSSSNQAMATPQRERSVTSIYRVTADGKVRRATSVPPATTDNPASYYQTKFYIPTTDNGLLVGGGFGPGPFNWWIGKFDAEGQRSWQAGPGPGYPEDVSGTVVFLASDAAGYVNGHVLAVDGGLSVTMSMPCANSPVCDSACNRSARLRRSSRRWATTKAC